MTTHSSTLAWKIPLRGAWRATAHRVTNSRAPLRGLSTHDLEESHPMFRITQHYKNLESELCLISDN